MENTENLSEVEQFFYQCQKAVGGNLKWHKINPQHQFMFTQAVNTIMQIVSATEKEQDE